MVDFIIAQYRAVVQLNLAVKDNFTVTGSLTTKPCLEGWMDGWVGGWKDAKAGLRIAYSNQK